MAQDSGYATGGGPYFFRGCHVYISYYRKKLTSILLLIWLGMPKYDPKRKREYYLANREKRLAYQNNYYKESKERFRRRKEINEVLEPEQEEARKKELSAYNRAYYVKNKRRILTQRRETVTRNNEKKTFL